MPDPANIRRLLRQNDQYAAAAAYAKDLSLGQHTSMWHEHHTQRATQADRMPDFHRVQLTNLKAAAYAPKDRVTRE